MSDDNFVKWLENLEPPGRGRQVRLAAKTGLSQSYISKLLARKTKQELNLTTLSDIADHMRVPLNDLAEEIFGPSGESDRSSPEVVVPIDAKYRKEWDALFRHNPARAKRVLENLILQERQGYTDLVSGIVALILAHGPEKAGLKIGAEIEKWTARRDGSSGRKRLPPKKKR